MYADRVTDSMRRAIDETNRRRRIQTEHNERHGITPVGIKKDVRALAERLRPGATAAASVADGASIATMPRDEIVRLIKDLESQMRRAAKELEYERAALLRDQIVE